MKTTLLATAIASLNIAKETGLLLTFNFGKLHIQGVMQSVSVSQETGAVTRGDLLEVNKTVDFETVDLSKLKEAVLSTVDSELFELKDVDLEKLICHQFKSVCTSVSFKALKTNCVSSGHVTEEERLELSKLNNADKFVNYLLPVVLCEEIAVKRTNTAIFRDLTAYYEKVASVINLETGILFDVAGILTARTAQADNKAITQVWLKIDYLEANGIEGKLQRHYKANMRYCETMFKDGTLNGVNIEDSYVVNLNTVVEEV
jgi:hypothetical protein